MKKITCQSLLVIKRFLIYLFLTHDTLLWQRANTWNGNFKSFTVANLVVNSVDDTKLPCYTLPLVQHHSFFRNLPPLFIYPYLPGTRYNYQNVMILKTNCTFFFFNQTAFPSRMLEQSNAAICALKLLSTALQMRWAFTLTLNKSLFCSFASCVWSQV